MGSAGHPRPPCGPRPCFLRTRCSVTHVHPAGLGVGSWPACLAVVCAHPRVLVGAGQGLAPRGRQPVEAGASAEGAKPRLTAATPAGVGHLVLACSALTREGEPGGQLVGGSRGAEAVPNARLQPPRQAAPRSARTGELGPAEGPPGLRARLGHNSGLGPCSQTSGSLQRAATAKTSRGGGPWSWRAGRSQAEVQGPSGGHSQATVVTARRGRDRAEEQASSGNARGLVRHRALRQRQASGCLRPVPSGDDSTGAPWSLPVHPPRCL